MTLAVALAGARLARLPLFSILLYSTLLDYLRFYSILLYYFLLSSTLFFSTLFYLHYKRNACFKVMQVRNNK